LRKSQPFRTRNDKMPPQEGEADLFKRENYKPTPKNHGPSLVSRQYE